MDFLLIIRFSCAVVNCFVRQIAEIYQRGDAFTFLWFSLYTTTPVYNILMYLCNRKHIFSLWVSNKNWNFIVRDSRKKNYSGDHLMKNILHRIEWSLLSADYWYCITITVTCRLSISRRQYQATTWYCPALYITIITYDLIFWWSLVILYYIVPISQVCCFPTLTRCEMSNTWDNFAQYRHGHIMYQVHYKLKSTVCYTELAKSNHTIKCCPCW